ncbi:MAG: phosphoenolpyruvate--protein phosphotransferase [Desertifilum sp. SIO1I2]|nr:phosphoenolpyruvate--protein phosphotransferase [Desertifilum sp. SIO1I2]
MVGILIVSHSRKLAQGIQELVSQMIQGTVPIAIAAGIDDPQRPLGTDPLQIQQAIEALGCEDGVLVLMDLGSAVLSAEMALEFLLPEQRSRVKLCGAPLVEGAIAAAVKAATGGNLDQVYQEAYQGLNGKQTHLSFEGTVANLHPATATPLSESREIHLTIGLPMGLHARPAAQLVLNAAQFESQITLRNLTRQTSAINAKSINQVMLLGTRQGDEIAIAATGSDATAALACLQELVENHFGETDFLEAPPPALATPPAIENNKLIGIPASSGIAIAPLYLYQSATSIVQHHHSDYPEIEWDELQLAIETAKKELQTLQHQTFGKTGEQQAAIFTAHSLYLSDPELLAEVQTLIFEQQFTAAAAWKNTIDRTVARYQALNDPLGRAVDVADVGERVLRLLAGTIASRIELPEPAILVANDLTPSQTAQLDLSKVKGICTVSGSATSHSGILARSLGLPAIVGLSSQLLRLQPGTLLAMNGDTGELWIEPPPAELRQLEQKQQAQTRTVQPALTLSTPTATRDGHRVKLMANINTLADAQAVKGSGAEGVGLLRSEFLFLDRTTLPTEAEQVALYQEIAAAVAPEPLFIRLLDIGGDKPLPCLKLPPEANPFLGYRGIRVLLDRPELLKTQLKAILRVSHQYAVKVILPMVSAIAEVQAVQEILSQAQLELEQANLGFNRQLEIGIMIEVPAAVNLCDRLAGMANFFSIGTNDLTQYVMASDRNNPQVAHLADAFAPAILRNIQQTVTNAHRAGIPVCVCGELAIYPEAIPILIGLGVDELSTPVSAIPQLKRIIAQIGEDEAGAIASAALNLDSGAAVRKYVASRFSIEL